MYSGIRKWTKLRIISWWNSWPEKLHDTGQIGTDRIRQRVPANLVQQDWCSHEKYMWSCWTLLANERHQTVPLVLLLGDFPVKKSFGINRSTKLLFATVWLWLEASGVFATVYGQVACGFLTVIQVFSFSWNKSSPCWQIFAQYDIFVRVLSYLVTLEVIFQQSNQNIGNAGEIYEFPQNMLESTRTPQHNTRSLSARAGFGGQSLMAGHNKLGRRPNARPVLGAEQRAGL